MFVLNVALTFGLSPSEAWREIFDRNPHNWLSDLMKVHNFRSAWMDIQRDPERKHGKDTDWHQLVQETEMDLVEQVYAERQARMKQSA